jgi:hypothetical protein
MYLRGAAGVTRSEAWPRSSAWIDDQELEIGCFEEIGDTALATKARTARLYPLDLPGRIFGVVGVESVLGGYDLWRPLAIWAAAQVGRVASAAAVWSLDRPPPFLFRVLPSAVMHPEFFCLDALCAAAAGGLL